MCVCVCAHAIEGMAIVGTEDWAGEEAETRLRTGLETGTRLRTGLQDTTEDGAAGHD